MQPFEHGGRFIRFPEITVHGTTTYAFLTKLLLLLSLFLTFLLSPLPIL